jgi:Uma2 family endonuclease
VRLWIPKHRQYTYPDVMVIEGEPVYTGTSTTTVTNSSLIVEVLSKSTENYDQGNKFLSGLTQLAQCDRQSIVHTY